MQTVVDALSRSITSSIRTRVNVRAIRRCETGFEIDITSPDGDWQLECRALVLAIPAHAYSEIRFEFDFPVTEPLARIKYPAVNVVFFGYKDNPSAVPLDGFGFLVPQKEGLGVLGTIWNSTLFSNRVPDGGTSFTTFVGGARQPKAAALPEDEVVDLVRGDLKSLLGITREPDVVQVKRWAKAIPQYNVGHLGIIDAIESCEKSVHGVFVSGNFRGGVAIADCVSQAQETSERVVTLFEK
jgi:oxygen-dependent protoporphyrinogen oxidase